MNNSTQVPINFMNPIDPIDPINPIIYMNPRVTRSSKVDPFEILLSIQDCYTSYICTSCLSFRTIMVVQSGTGKKQNTRETSGDTCMYGVRTRYTYLLHPCLFQVTWSRLMDLLYISTVILI